MKTDGYVEAVFRFAQRVSESLWFMAGFITVILAIVVYGLVLHFIV